MSDLSALHRGLEDVEHMQSVLTGKARRRLPSILTESGFVRAILREARELLREVGGEVRKLGPRLRRSTRIDWRGATTAQRNAAIQEMVNLLTGLPSAFLPGVVGVLNKRGAKVFRDTHIAVAAKNAFRVIPAFAIQNRVAIEAIATTTSIFFSPAYDVAGDRFKGRAQEIVAQGIREGLGNREIARDLERAFRRTGISKNYWETVAAVHTNRSRSFSHLQSYIEAGVTRYEIVAVLDEATTPICFPPGTPVTTPLGPRYIGDVRPGDLVTGRDGSVREVEAISVSQASEWVRIELEDGREIEATPGHPFWRSSHRGGDWVRAGDLLPGDELQTMRDRVPIPTNSQESPGEKVLLSEMLRPGQEERDIQSVPALQGRGEVVAESPEKVLLNGMSGCVQARVGRQKVRALREEIQGEKGLRQSGPVQILLQRLSESSAQKGNPGSLSRESLCRMRHDVSSRTSGTSQDAPALLQEVLISQKGAQLRALRRRIQGRQQSDRAILLEVMLQEVRGRIFTGGAHRPLSGRTRGPVRARGGVRSIFDRLRPVGFWNRTRDRRRVLASQGKLEEGHGYGQGWLRGPAGGLQEAEGGADDLGADPALFRGVKISSVETFHRSGLAYNLQVAGDPVYLVCGGILVHNCTMLNGRTFGVLNAAERFNAFEAATDMDEAKEALPFMSVSGNEILTPGGDVAGVVGPRGGISDQLSSTALQGAGMSTPPFHHRCRTTIVPVI